MIDIEEYEQQVKHPKPRSKKIKLSATSHAQLTSGKITLSAPEVFHVSTDQKSFTCSIKGTLKKELKAQKDRLCCGDIVLFDAEKKVIVKRCPRKTLLMRENPTHKHQEQILAANVDQLLITTSVLQPPLNPYLIDLYLIAAERAKLKPVIVVNKIDLLKSSHLATQAQSEERKLHHLKKQYEALNIPMVFVSAKNLEGFDQLQTLMQKRASVFSGESGVGKSSLINAIEKTSLKIGDLSAKSKGTHTTTTSQLLPLKFGGWCVDTPGIQSLSFQKLSLLEIRDAFAELINCGCRFSDCLHQNEKGCAIQEALETQTVFLSRLESYQRLISENISSKSFKKYDESQK